VFSSDLPTVPWCKAPYRSDRTRPPRAPVPHAHGYVGCCTATTVEEVTVPKRTAREKPRTRLLAAARLGLLPLRSFLRTPLTRAALGALLLIPLMYSG